MKLLLITLSFLTLFQEKITDYPIPAKKENHLFYIQRTLNTNTIVYEANFNSNGKLNEEEPILIKWILYEENGKIEGLTRLEKAYAYGIKHKKVENKSNEYHLQLVSYKKLNLKLKQVAPFEAKVLLEKGNEQESSLDHIFVHANNKGFWTKVSLLEVYTHMSNSNELKKEDIYID